MFFCFEGTPGSGKTYDAVKKILDNLKGGRVVYTNIDGINEDDQKEFIKLYTGLDDYELSKKLIHLSANDVSHFWEIVKSGSLIVIDEVHKWFSNRDWQTEKNKQFADWASTHRHYGYDVVLITQNLEKVDVAVRTLVEWTYRYKKVNFFGGLTKNSYIRYAYSEDSNHCLGHSYHKYDKSIFNCYQSYVTGDIKELGVMTSYNVLRHPVFLAIPVVFIITAFLFMKSSFAKGDLFGAQEALKRAQFKNSTTSYSNKKPGTEVKTHDVVSRPLAPERQINLKGDPKKRVSETIKNSDSYRIGGLGYSDQLYVLINGLGSFTLQEFNNLFKKGAYYTNEQLCFDGRCYGIGDSFDG